MHSLSPNTPTPKSQHIKEGKRNRKQWNTRERERERERERKRERERERERERARERETEREREKFHSLHPFKSPALNTPLSQTIENIMYQDNYIENGVR